jgi:hypothetical protein
MNTEKNGFTKYGGSPPTKTRKLSWQYEDLAFKIQVAPRHFAARDLLRFLGKAANDGGTSHYGYESLMANCGIRSRTAMATTVKYLLTVGIDEVKQPILTRTQGDGKNTSRYKLHLGAMQKLVKHQGVFDPETGKLIRHTKWERPDGVPVSDTPAEEGVPVSGGGGVPVSDTPGVPVNEQGGTCESYSNPHITLSENPKDKPLSKAATAEEDSSVFEDEAPSPTPDRGTNGETTPISSARPAQRFSLKRWCPVCNEPAKLGGGDECSHCGAENEWLTAPRSDAYGKRLMEQILGSADDRRVNYANVSVSQRRWIAMGKYAAEFEQWLAENGDTK